MTERTPGHPDTGPGGHLAADIPGYPPARRAPLSAQPDGHQPGTRQRTGEPLLASVSSWAVLVSGFGLSASTWIALAVLAGFDGQVTIPTMSGWVVTLQLAWLMPVAIDGYVVTALVLWMAPVPAAVAAFAKKNTYAAAGIGVLAQSAYHALFTWAATGVMWRAVLAAVVGALPPAVCALAVHMRALIRRESGQRTAPSVDTRPEIVLDIRADSPMSALVDTWPDVQADSAAVSVRTAEPDTATVTALAGRTRRSGQAADISVEDLADTLGAKFKGRIVGQPTAIVELKRVYGTCSRTRAIKAKDIHNARVAGQVDIPPAGGPGEVEDDQEREPALATATA